MDMSNLTIFFCFVSLFLFKVGGCGNSGVVCGVKWKTCFGCNKFMKGLGCKEHPRWNWKTCGE